MDTQSIERDNSILKIVGKSIDNIQMLKEIIDNLTTRIEKLEKNKLDKPKEGLKEYKKHMETILGTKLYWALIRCLEPNFNDRYFLYI